MNRCQSQSSSLRPFLLASATATASLLGITSLLILVDDPPSHRSRRVSLCEMDEESQRNTASAEQSRSRKRKTLRFANESTEDSSSNNLPPRRFNTREEISKLKKNQHEMLRRWERDEEENWRTLPARAWPAYQPNPEEVQRIQRRILLDQPSCTLTNISSTSSACQELLFQVATGLVFYNVDSEEGLRIFRALANAGNVDAMVACGIVLVEGFGGQISEEEGLDWLRKAVEHGSVQGYYELACLLYTGIDGVLEEDGKAAFALFQRAAAAKHPGGMYMCADCLLEGEDCPRDVGEALVLLYEAAERGHRYARQRVRELLKEYQ